eukprot:TRINITY_DN1107_c0_g1_i1.p2 TRINITY_DN1107_c0_g1~~TRINITY_DN1107_c0_g1_i1.p2  ORF type:complete len:114 (-),score=38.04 TRINITY_DN1107_c0_g1_i1:10-351(-)
MQLLNINTPKLNQPKYICDAHQNEKNQIQFICEQDHEILCSQCAVKHQNHKNKLWEYTEASIQEDCKSLKNTLKEQQQTSHQKEIQLEKIINCLLYTSPSPRDKRQSRMPSSA